MSSSEVRDMMLVASCFGWINAKLLWSNSHTKAPVKRAEPFTEQHSKFADSLSSAQRAAQRAAQYRVIKRTEHLSVLEFIYISTKSNYV